MKNPELNATNISILEFCDAIKWKIQNWTPQIYQFSNSMKRLNEKSRVERHKYINSRIPWND